jgi:hypothetical protein
MIVKRVGVMSAGKVLGAIYLVIGFIAGLFVAVTTALQGNADNIGAVAVVTSITLLAPVLYAIAGFVTGALMAALYNFMTPFVGGFELEFESRA